jgi:hypothetical protein
MTDAVLARWEYVRDAPRAQEEFVLRLAAVKGAGWERSANANFR